MVCPTELGIFECLAVGAGSEGEHKLMKRAEASHAVERSSSAAGTVALNGQIWALMAAG